MRHFVLDTPTGPFAVTEDDESRLGTGWVIEDRPPGESDPAFAARLVEDLRRYFKGDPEVDFDWVPLAGGPAFFRRCWTACRAIPRGEMRTYAELSLAAGGGRTGARAAGQAMRRNPLPIVVPCHRVRSSGGGLGGFSGCIDPDDRALLVKRWLLALEGALPAADTQRGLFEDADALAPIPTRDDRT